MSDTWKNDFIFTKFECSRCRATEHKQIPKEWTDIQIIAYFPEDYFCVQCGMHGFFPDTDKKVLTLNLN